MEYSKDGEETTEELENCLKKVTRWFTSTCDYESTWRKLARTWHDYYHGDQLPPELIKEMMARSQPPLKFNLVKSIVNLLSGQEIQGRTDIQFVGTEESDSLPAELLTDVYRQKNNEGYCQYEITEAFQDSVIGGRGVLQHDWDEDSEEIFLEYTPWEEVFVDPCAKRKDYSDARHVFRVKWVDLDVAIDMFPDHEGKIRKITKTQDVDEKNFFDQGKEPATHTDDYFDDIFDNPQHFYDPDRDRIKLIEVWWKTSDSKTGIMNGVFSQDCWIEEPEDFGRKHGDFPFVFTFYARDRKGLPYGLVKDLVDPQDVINRSFSKSMHILGTRQILAEKGALPNVHKVQDEICRPDAIINDFEDGALQNGKVRIEENRGDAQMAFQHFEIGVNAMHRISGVNPELQGLHTNARSGTAISMRMRQGNTVLTSLYDCLEKTKKKLAEKFIYLMSQYMKKETVMRYKLPNGEYANITLNGTTQEVVKDELVRVKINEIKDIFKYDIVITESAKAATASEHTMSQLVELAKAVPQVITPQFIAELVKSTHLPNKEDLAKAVLSPPGQPGGDATATPGIQVQ